MNRDDGEEYDAYMDDLTHRNRNQNMYGKKVKQLYEKKQKRRGPIKRMFELQGRAVDFILKKIGEELIPAMEGLKHG